MSIPNFDRLRAVAILSMSSATLVACGSSSNGSTASDAGGTEDANTGGDAGLGGDAASLDRTPIPTPTPSTWTFVPVQGAMCRDGSSTGIGINTNPASKNLMIFLEGGGACFNALTCASNPASFGMTEFTTRLGGTSGSGGIFNRMDAANPVADWNFVYVPFCTGDVHGGDAPNTTVPGVTAPQQFVGYANMTRYLARLVPTFPGLSKVLLTGISAGGFGAALNYQQTARAFAPVPVYDLDDSGPPMEDPYAAMCLQGEWAQLWGLDKTFLADCGSDCPNPMNYTLDGLLHVAKAYPNVPFGLVEDTDDAIITLFYGFGANSCSGLPSPLTGATFTMGLLDERAKTASLPNVGSFLFQGTDHTTLGMGSFDTRTAGGGEGGASVKLTDWIAALVGGQVTNVGP